MVEQNGELREMSIDLKSTIAGVENEVNSHRIHENPFLNEIGFLDISTLRDFLIQQYFISSSFPQAIAAVYSRIPNFESEGAITPGWVTAEPLVKIIQNDLWGSRDVKSRSSKYIDLFSFLGVKKDELIQVRQLQSTSKFIEIRKNLCLDKPVLSAVSGLGFMELAVGKIYKRYIDGAIEIDRDIPLDYFKAQVQDGATDYEIFRDIILKLGPSQKGNAQELIKGGAIGLLNARDQWYTDLHKRFIQNKS